MRRLPKLCVLSALLPLPIGCDSTVGGTGSLPQSTPDAEVTAVPDADSKVIRVCPEAGPGCHYVGGEGLQQAIIDNPGTAVERSLIQVREGTYLRQEGTNFESGTAFVVVDGAFTELVAEGAVLLDGESSAQMSGVALVSGQLTLSGFELNGFRGDGIIVFDGASIGGNALVIRNSDLNGMAVGGNAYASLASSSIESSGWSGITVAESAGVTVVSTTISGSGDWAVQARDTASLKLRGCTVSDNAKGIFVNNQATAEIRNNLILRGFNGVYGLDAATLTIENNTFDGNEVAGINLYHCGESNPSATIVGNVIVNTLANDDGSFGYAVGGPCWMIETNPNNDEVTHNLVWSNARDLLDCDSNENCGSSGRLLSDPEFVSESDYHLQEGSPGINSGATGVSDPDGSLLDRGAYGGPGACALDSSLAGC